MIIKNAESQYIPNILIVDDIFDNLKVLGNILNAEGFKVRPVPNGVLALQAAEKDIPDLILLDIMMPGMDGFEVCRKLKANHKLCDIPIIFISALNDTNDIVKALNIGGVDYITKPFQAEEVRARVNTQLNIQKQNKELLRLNNDKDRFISILAHDLKGPLRGVLALSEILVENIRKYDIDDIEHQMIMINNSSQQVSNLLNDLLMWGMAQSGKLPFKLQKLNLNVICKEVLEILKLVADNKNITLHHSAAENLELIADAQMLKTILRNLISNAIKFSNIGGSINIHAERTNSTITISVSDNGIGMSEEILNKLFDISQIITSTGTAKESGTGLGLVLCKEFIDKHMGKIWVESQLGKGSKFYISLPII